MTEHEHDHEHEHHHEHEHGHEHEHEHHHEHEHEHHHDHEHDHHHHDHGPMENREQVTALLDYMYKHNRSHEDELVKMAEKLKSLGNEAEASKVSEARDYFAKGNELLSEALAQLGS